MAIRTLTLEEIKNNMVYTGLSTDTKPAMSIDPERDLVESLFHETDTGDVWSWSGDSGSWYRIINNGLQMGTDPYLDISSGAISSTTVVNKFGANASVADGTAEEVWDGNSAYTWPTTASITHIRSAVDSATTQGMVVEVQGVDTNYTLTVQNATLDGADSTTEVALSTALRRVFRMKVLDSSTADQAIWVGPTGFASQQGVIQAGNNQTLMALYTVPAGKTAYMTNYYASVIGEASPPATIPDYVLFRLWQRDNDNGYAPQLKHEIGSAILGSSIVNREFRPYYKITEKNDIWIEATPDGDDASVSAGFDLILVDD